MSSSMIEEMRKKIYNWGIQEILDTTNIETKEEAWQIVQEIWLRAIRDCSKPLQSIELEGVCKRRILDWCAKNKKL